MNAGRIVLRLIVLLLAAGAAVCLVVGWRQSPVTLAKGLQCVEIADADGVTRIERALKASGQADEATVLHCAWLARRGHHDEALRQLPQRLATGPLRRDVLKLVGESLFRVGDLQQAEVALTTVAAEFPDEVEVHRLLAVMYYDLGSNDLALSALAKVQRLAPLDYRPHHLAGLIKSDTEDFEGAIQQLRLALKKQPPGQVGSDIRRELARTLIHVRVREYQAAVEVLEADVASAERSALLAECHWSLGNKARANGLVEEVLALDPDHVPSLRVKVQLLEDEGKTDEAIAVLRRILAAEPYDVERRYQFVQLLGIRGLTEERDREQQEYLRYRSLQDRLVALNLKASAEPDAVAPRQELVEVCRALGRTQLAAMWQRAVTFCEQRRQQRESAAHNSAAR